MWERGMCNPPTPRDPQKSREREQPVDLVDQREGGEGARHEGVLEEEEAAVGQRVQEGEEVGDLVGAGSGVEEGEGGGGGRSGGQSGTLTHTQQQEGMEQRCWWEWGAERRWSGHAGKGGEAKPVSQTNCKEKNTHRPQHALGRVWPFALERARPHPQPGGAAGERRPLVLLLVVVVLLLAAAGHQRRPRRTGAAAGAVRAEGEPRGRLAVVKSGRDV
jgi:hypothetical protein